MIVNREDALSNFQFENNVTNSTGGTNGTVTGTESYTDSISGRAFVSIPTNRIDIGNGDLDNTSNLTIFMKMNLDTLTNGDRIFGKRTTIDTNGFYLFVNSAGADVFTWRARRQDDTDWVSLNLTLPETNVYSLRCEINIDANEITISSYSVDGTLQTASASGDFTTNYTSNTSNITISNLTDGTSNGCDGSIDDFTIVKGILTDEDFYRYYMGLGITDENFPFVTITPESYAGGLYWLDFTDASTVTLDTGLVTNVTDKFTATSNDWGQPTALERPAYNTAGTYNYVEFNEAAHILTDAALDIGTRTFTACWYGTLYDDTDGDNGVLLEVSDNVNNVQSGLLINLDSTSTNTLKSLYKDGAFDVVEIDYTSLYGVAKFHCVTMNKATGGAIDNIKIYTDGVLTGNTVSSDAANNTLDFGNYVHYMGERNSDVSEIFADINEFFTYNTELSQADITALYNNYIVPKYGL